MATKLYSAITGVPVVLPVLGEDIAFTPSLNNFTTAYATQKATWRRVGSHMQGTVYIVLGAVSAIGGTYTMTIPGGLTFDTLNFAATSDGKIGDFYIDDSSASYLHFVGTVQIISTTTMEFKTHGQTALNNATIPVTLAVNDIFAFDFDIPIFEWRGAANQAYGAGQATSVKPGIVGGTNGAAVTTGNVGETRTASTTSAVYTATATWENVSTLVLTTGVYVASANLVQSFNNSTSPTNLALAISACSGATVTDHTTVNTTQTKPSISNTDDCSLILPMVPVRCDGTNIYIGGFTIAGTTLYLKSKINYTGTAPTRSAALTILRVS